MKRLLALVGLAILALGCAPESQQTPSQTSNVFDQDDRLAITSQAYPWRTIGKLKLTDRFGNKSHCSGTLVGKDIVLTNRHCVVDSEGYILPQIWFFPNYMNGRSFYISKVAWVEHGSFADDQDWAIVRLRSPLGERLGWMNYDYMTVNDYGPYDGAMNLAGYSGDFEGGETAGVHMNCNIKAVNSNIVHNCDSTQGASGGPLFTFKGERAVIIGVNSAEYRDTAASHVGIPWSWDKANFGVLSDRFVPVINRFKRTGEGQYQNTAMNLCNKSRANSLSAVLAIEQNHRIKTIGWYRVAKDTCEEIDLGFAYTGNIYHYAEYSNGAKTDGTGGSFCISRDTFTLPNANVSQCPAGFWHANFARPKWIQPGQLNAFVYR